MAAALWPKILQHKWLMSEKLGRDVGLRTACIDFVEHMEQAMKEYVDYRRNRHAREVDYWYTAISRTNSRAFRGEIPSARPLSSGRSLEQVAGMVRNMRYHLNRAGD